MHQVHHRDCQKTKLIGNISPVPAKKAAMPAKCHLVRWQKRKKGIEPSIYRYPSSEELSYDTNVEVCRRTTWPLALVTQSAQRLYTVHLERGQDIATWPSGSAAYELVGSLCCRVLVIASAAPIAQLLPPALGTLPLYARASARLPSYTFTNRCM